MRSGPASVLQAGVVVAVCAVAGAQVSRPCALPASVRAVVDQAVDASAQTWLWLWGRSADSSDGCLCPASDTPADVPCRPIASTSPKPGT